MSLITIIRATNFSQDGQKGMPTESFLQTSLGLLVPYIENVCKVINSTGSSS